MARDGELIQNCNISVVRRVILVMCGNKVTVFKYFATVGAFAYIKCIFCEIFAHKKYLFLKVNWSITVHIF